MNAPGKPLGLVHQPAGETMEARLQRLEAKLGSIVQADGSITLLSRRKVEINVGGNVLVVDASGISLRGNGRLELISSNKVAIQASTTDISASQVKLNAGMVSATGVVKASTLQADNVIATTYAPGAGNIW